jgi:hypothetical protein
MHATYEQLYAYCSLRKQAVDEKHLVSKPLGIHPLHPFIQINSVYTHHTQVYVLEDGCVVKGWKLAGSSEAQVDAVSL